MYHTYLSLEILLGRFLCYHFLPIIVLCIQPQPGVEWSSVSDRQLMPGPEWIPWPPF